MRVKKGDKVIILTGRDRGKSGIVEKVFPKDNQVLIPGINTYKKHQRAAAGQRGGVISKVRPIGADKVMVMCPKCGLKTRVSHKRETDGESYRICKKCSATM